MATTQRNVLVTGASSGIGLACTERLARAGWHVFGTVRNEHDAEQLARVAGNVTPLLLDVRDTARIEAAARRVEEVTGEHGLDGLVNNAGIAIAGPLEFLPLDALRLQLEVNVIGQVAVTQAMLPALRRARGRIVFIGSIAGRSALPLTGAYSASKFAIEAISTTLRVELRKWDIRSCVIEPGAFGTRIWDTGLDRANEMLKDMPAEVEEHYGDAIHAVRNVALRSRRAPSPEPVAATVERALTSARPRARYLLGQGARMRILLEWLPAGIRDRIVERRVRAMGNE